MKPPSLTIGIEEEYQIIDPKTRELKSYITQFLEEGKLMMREAVKAELLRLLPPEKTVRAGRRSNSRP